MDVIRVELATYTRSTKRYTHLVRASGEDGAGGKKGAACDGGLTCRMASLCISPVQAGIMPFSTANSSFILDLLRLSMRLWAVLLAIFLPAALVADGCFLLLPRA